MFAIVKIIKNKSGHLELVIKPVFKRLKNDLNKWHDLAYHGNPAMITIN